MVLLDQFSKSSTQGVKVVSLQLTNDYLCLGEFLKVFSGHTLNCGEPCLEEVDIHQHHQRTDRVWLFSHLCDQLVQE